MSSRFFRENCYFCIYDFNDVLICYCDNFNELTKHINYTSRDLLKQFKKHGNCLNVLIDSHFYKLYLFYD